MLDIAQIISSCLYLSCIGYTYRKVRILSAYMLVFTYNKIVTFPTIVTFADAMITYRLIQVSIAIVSGDNKQSLECVVTPHRSRVLTGGECATFEHNTHKSSLGRRSHLQLFRAATHFKLCILNYQILQ